MRSRELFGVGVRLLAVWYFGLAVTWAYWGVLIAVQSPSGAMSVVEREDVSNMVLYVLLGTALMAGARLVTWVAYGDDATARSDSDTTSDAPARVD